MTVASGKYRGSQEYLLVYCKLIGAALNGKTVTYQDIAPIMGLPSSGHLMGAEIGRLLDEINEDEHRRGRPMLSATVVGSSAVPGDGFFKLARRLGKLQKSTRRGERSFWEAEKAAVYATWQRRLG